VLLSPSGSNIGWISLSSPTPGTDGFASYNYCGGQCSYDMPVYSPPGYPDVVYIGGAMQYDEIFPPGALLSNPKASNGRAVQRSETKGVSFTDMTVDSHGSTRHPDQHAMAGVPFSSDILFNADDGGIWRLDGSFTNAS